MTSPDPTAATSKSLRGVRLAARRRRIYTSIFVFLLLVAFVLFAKPLYHQFKRRRAEHFAAQGDAFFAQKDWAGAATKYKAALQLDAQNFSALRGAARLGTRAGQLEALEFWKQIDQRPELTLEDHQQFARLALQAGQLGIAEREIAALVQSHPDAETLSLASEYFAQRDNLPKALEFARAAVQAAPGDETRLFALAHLLARSPDVALQTEAKQFLWKLSAAESTLRQAALEALAAAPNLSADEQKRVAEALRALPNLSAKDDLLAAGLTINLDPAAADSIYDAAIAKWRNGSVEERAELGRWLNAAGQFTRVLALFPAAAPADKPELLLVQLDALAGLRKWEEIDELLGHKNLPLDAVVAESFRARVASERHLPLEAELHWSRALDRAGNDPAKLEFIARFAESTAPAESLKIYDQLTRFPPHAVRAARAAQRLLGQSGDLIGLQAVTAKLAGLEPQNPDLQNEATYLQLLLGRDLPAASQAAQALAAKFPERLAFRITRALGLLRLKKYPEALTAFDSPTPIDWSKTPAAWRSVYLATLAANHHEDAARKLAAGIPMAQLLPPERELLTQFLPPAG